MSRGVAVVSLIVVMLVGVLLMPATAAASSESSGKHYCGGYVVKWGDTLSGIAHRHGTTVWALMKANPHIKSPDRIWAGMCLNIWGKWDGGTWDGGHGKYYIVRYGDTLTRIAHRFGTTVWAIKKANPHIWNPDKIYAGQKLIIPW